MLSDVFLDLAIDPAPEWMDRALCATADPSAFVGGDGSADDAALGICGRCPVRAECAAHADEHDERHGIWGGVRRG